MVSPRSLLWLASGLLLALGLNNALVPSTLAQDRSPPRFGPLVAPDTVRAAPTDLGRLWSMAQPPLDYLQNTYDVRADERGLRHLRLGTVRLPGCSGAVVSPQGLVLTAARCVRPFLPTGAGDSLRADAFLAEEQDEEQPLPGLYAERIVGVEVVTDTVVRKGREAVEAQLQAETGPNERVEIVSEAGGGRHVAYTYRRHENVHLAFHPDRAVTLAGRLGEFLTYPQHAWDVAVLRIHADGEDAGALSTPNFLSVRRPGARPGDAVFAVGHPAETRRAETHHQLALRRDLQLPARLSAVRAWIRAFRRDADSSARTKEALNRLADAQATRRQLRARLDALRSDYVMNRLRARDRALKRTRRADTIGGRGLIGRLAALQEEKRTYAERYRAFSFLLHPAYSSATMRRSVLVARAQAQGRPLSELTEALGAIPNQSSSLDAALMRTHLDRLRRHRASDSSLVQTLQGLGSPDSLVEASVFANAERLRARLRAEDLPTDDPAFELAGALADRYANFRSDWSALTEQETRLTDSLARVRHRAAERPVTLPQDRTLRMADGRIEGYPYGGTVMPPLTTFYGLYGRHQALQGDESRGDESLPAPWRSPGGGFERSTPLMTVASTDLGGGAYGGPLVNTSLELVGIVADGNVQSAAGRYLFLPERMRTVVVDVRGAIEGLSTIYEAERLVKEMTEPAQAP